MTIILITGATDGIGLETAQQLARQGHKSNLAYEIVLHGRSEEKLQRARNAIQHNSPGVVLHTVHAELTDLSAVTRMAQDLAVQQQQLDVLINNAGVYMTERRLTQDGFEMTLAVNHLAHFLLTNLLLPLLKKSSGPRVVTVSSITHSSGRIDFDNLNSQRHFDAYQAYANSKLANALFANSLARRESWLTSNSLHPGVINTKLLHSAFDMAGASVAEGARTPVYLATSPEVTGTTGKYFDRCSAVQPAPSALDQRLAQQLWAWSENALRPYFPTRTG